MSVLVRLIKGYVCSGPSHKRLCPLWSVLLKAISGLVRLIKGYVCSRPSYERLGREQT